MIAAVIIAMLAWGLLIYRNHGRWNVDRLDVGPLRIILATSPLFRPLGFAVLWEGNNIIDWRVKGFGDE